MENSATILQFGLVYVFTVCISLVFVFTYTNASDQVLLTVMVFNVIVSWLISTVFKRTTKWDQ